MEMLGDQVSKRSVVTFSPPSCQPKSAKLGENGGQTFFINSEHAYTQIDMKRIAKLCYASSQI